MTDFSNNELKARAARRKPANPADDHTTPDPHPVHALQNSVGNRAVQRMLKPSLNTTPRVQTKLHVGAANDPYEAEADNVAKQVVSQINAPVQRAEEDELATKRIQRAGMPEEEEMLQGKRIQRVGMPEEEEMLQGKRIQRVGMPEEEEMLQGKRIQRVGMPEEEEMLQGKRIQRAQEDEMAMKRIQRVGMPEEEEMLQGKRADISRSGGSEEVDMMGEFDVGGGTEQQINTMKGGGQALPTSLSRKMGDAMGADFSGVRVHTGDQSNQLNQNLSAQAFTHGQDIFFGPGKYEPGSSSGQELLAHELTHVVQQSGSAVRKEEKQ